MTARSFLWTMTGALIALLIYLLITIFFWTPFAFAEPPNVHSPPMDHHNGRTYYEDNHPPAGAPDPYQGIKNKEDLGCCNGDDCKRIRYEHEFYFKVKGGYQLIETGEFIPESKVANSPDGNYHLCRYEGWTERKAREKVKGEYAKHPKTGEPLVPIRCLMIPPGGV